MEILDKILKINTYTELISYFQEVIKQLGKTRIKSVYDTSGFGNCIDGELYIVFEDNRALVIANTFTSYGNYELQSKYNIRNGDYSPKRENGGCKKLLGIPVTDFHCFLPFLIFNLYTSANK